jgi:hypothetical protein
MGSNDFCPICGVRFGSFRHRCSAKALDAIDRRRDIDEKDPCYNRKPIERSYGDQLSLGFGLTDPDFEIEEFF